jgi:hypothetical protein
VLSTAWLQVFAQTERAEETKRDRLLATLDRKATVEPVVFEDRHDMYPLVLLAPERAGGWHFLYIDERQLAGVDNLRLTERDTGRAIARFYPRFQLIEWRSLNRYPAFSLVAKDDDLPRIERDYPGFSKRRVEGQLYELSRKRQGISLEVEEN